MFFVKFRLQICYANFFFTWNSPWFVQEYDIFILVIKCKTILVEKMDQPMCVKIMFIYIYIIYLYRAFPYIQLQLHLITCFECILLTEKNNSFRISMRCFLQFENLISLERAKNSIISFVQLFFSRASIINCPNMSLTVIWNILCKSTGPTV